MRKKKGEREREKVWKRENAVARVKLHIWAHHEITTGYRKIPNRVHHMSAQCQIFYRNRFTVAVFQYYIGCRCATKENKANTESSPCGIDWVCLMLKRKIAQSHTLWISDRSKKIVRINMNFAAKQPIQVRLSEQKVKRRTPKRHRKKKNQLEWENESKCLLLGKKMMIEKWRAHETE